jgi:hypothetical protein
LALATAPDEHAGTATETGFGSEAAHDGGAFFKAARLGEKNREIGKETDNRADLSSDVKAIRPFLITGPAHIRRATYAAQRAAWFLFSLTVLHHKDPL